MNDTPRTLLGWTVPDHITFTIDEGSYVHITCRWALEDDCSTTTAKGNLAWIGQFLQAHAHGQVVEHRKCSCFVTPESRWTTYGDATEPGSMMEPNPECTVHGQVVEPREWCPSCAGLGDVPCAHRPGQVVEHQPAADSEDDKLAEIGRRVMDDWAREIENLTAERDRLQARIDKALALCEPHPLRHLDTQLSIAGVLRGEEES